jgi:hypothetical protein
VPSAGMVVYGSEVAVMPELKCEGDMSDCATVKSDALAPQSPQNSAPWGISLPQLEQKGKPGQPTLCGLA